MQVSRGRRKSLTAAGEDQLSLVSLGLFERPDPPGELDEGEARAWRMIVNRMPPAWFTDETIHLLRSLCCTISTVQQLEGEIRRVQSRSIQDDAGLAALERLLAMRQRETTLAMHLSTKLRITPHSRIDALKAGSATRNTPVVRPWEAA